MRCCQTFVWGAGAAPLPAAAALAAPVARDCGATTVAVLWTDDGSHTEPSRDEPPSDDTDEATDELPRST